MNAEKLSQLFDEPAPVSSIRKASPAPPVPRASREVTPGTVLGDKYQVERCIGEGAMGVVFAARHLGLDETVAIKFVRPDVPDTGGAMARFAREAKLAARIHSEHVAKVFDVGAIEPLGPFIVMEYLEGASLAQVLETEGPLQAERLVGYLLQACEALAAAHAAGVVHRDVKPDNLFVTRRAGTEVIRLLDFGIAQVLPNGPALEGDAANGPEVVLGSPLYMAPEQLRPDSLVGARADIWALGVVSYELLSGNMPFAGSSLPEICASILDAEPLELGPSCPAALAAIVRRCLMKDPAQRFGSIAELAAALLPLAARDAHSYASRASSILRASSAMPAAALVAIRAEPSAARREGLPAARRERSSRRGVRFHSSALVASATILALAALGVVATLSRANSDEPSPAAIAVVAPEQPVSREAVETPLVPREPSLASPAQPPGLVSESGTTMTANEPRAPLTSESRAPMTSLGPPPGLASEPPSHDLDALPTAPTLAGSAIVAGAVIENAVPAPRLEPAARAEAARPVTARVRARRANPGQARLVREAAGRRRAASRVRLVEPQARPRLVAQERAVTGRRAP